MFPRQGNSPQDLELQFESVVEHHGFLEIDYIAVVCSSHEGDQACRKANGISHILGSANGWL